MEIKELILLIWRNIRSIILSLIVGAAIGGFLSKIQAPVYEATAKVFVSRPRQQGNTDILSLSDDQLLAINLQLAKSQPVLNDVSSQLGSKIDADNIEVAEIPNTLMLQIKVQDHDPKRAAQINKLLVQSLIQENETLISGQYTGFETALNQQIDQVQKQIDDLQAQVKQISTADIHEQQAQVSQQINHIEAEISGLQQEIGGLPYSVTPYPDVPTPAPLERIPLAQKQSQLDQLRSLLTLYQQVQTNLTYIGKPAEGESNLENPCLAALQSTLTLYQQISLSLINNRQNVRLARAQNSQNVVQINAAIPPKTPVRPVPVLYVLLGALVGVGLAVTAIIVIDHMNDSLKTSAQIEKLLDLPVLGFISDTRKNKNGLVTASDPDSNEAESFRGLGANLEIAGIGKSIRTLMIVNVDPANEKTTIAANLAVIHAQQGKKVILVDGDLKHPYLHTLFELENQKGLAELLDGRIDTKSPYLAFHIIENVPGITLISSGTVEKAVTGWLDTEKLAKVMSTLREQTDIVIVDSPPADVANAQVLASEMDAVLLAISAGHTHVNSAQATLRRFKLNGVRVVGAVFNRTRPSWKLNKQLIAKLGVIFRKIGSPIYSRN